MGGNCSKVIAQVASVNPDDQIGVPITIHGGCGLAGSAFTSLGSYIPSNGEYEWAGEGSTCYYCSANVPNSITCPAGCADLDCCAVVGVQGTYKRKSYNADPVECCKTGKSLLNNLTCHPKYRNPKSQDCYKILKDYCIQGANLFTEDVCKTWCTANPEECVTYQSKVCNGSSNLNFGCKQWCLHHPGMCDSSAEEYCKNDTTGDDYCACLRSDVQKFNYNPICVDRKCIDHGYQTASMLSARGDKCQDVVDCNTYFDISAGGKVDFADVNIQQRCRTPPNPPTPPPPTIPPSSQSLRYSNLVHDHKILLIGTMVAVVVWILIVVIIGITRH